MSVWLNKSDSCRVKMFLVLCVFFLRCLFSRVAGLARDLDLTRVFLKVLDFTRAVTLFAFDMMAACDGVTSLELDAITLTYSAYF